MRFSTAIRPCLLLSAALLTGATTAAADWVEVRKLEKEVLLGDSPRVHVNLSVGDLTVEGIDGSRVEVELTLECNRKDVEGACKARADRILLAPRMGRKELKVRLRRTPQARFKGIRARMTVRMPRGVPLEVDVKGGAVYVTGLASHLNINSGTGDVDVLASRDRTNEVKATTGFGNADLWLGDGRIKGTGWPKAINWKGSGDARIDIDVVGSGEISVRLE